MHGAAVAVMFLWPRGPIQKTPSAYDQLFKGKESQIVFYKFKDKLPDVKPVASADRRPPRAEVKIPKQQIVSSPKNAPKGTQMVWTPAPELKLTKEMQSPNIVALKMPAPPTPERKKFVPPSPAKVTREAKSVQPVDAPQVLAAKATPDPLVNLGVAPKLTVSNRPRFVAPEARAPAKAAEPVREMPAAPALAAAGDASAANALANLQQSQLNVAVVGLNPSDKNTLPEGSRATQFSAGPKLNPDGGTGEKGNGLSVPDLFVKGGGAEAKPTLMARSIAPTSAEGLRGLSKYGSVTGEPSSAPRTSSAAAAHVANAPNSRFEGREVYSMAIQMPNITSYVGSWLMWYADHDATAHTGPVSPPVPHHKVDPKYIATAAEERIEGRVQLLCVIRNSGKVDQVELIRGVDDRLNQSAMEALSKWEFTPATRGGVPVDVDVMVEIPFRLAPKLPAPR